MPSLAGLFSRKSKSTQSSPNVYQNNVAASSSKLRLPFSRKKPSTSSTSLLPPSITSASDSPIDHRRLRPPPSKSAIFAAYADPQIALSTRSLPPSPLPTPPPQKSSFFQWGSKSTPSTPHYIKKSDSPTEEKSFNLKAFRHISNNSDISLNQGPPRPRGTSITSESSQRISVAAFREVQARRSTTDSPVPSFRATSPTKPDPKRRSSNLALTSESDDGSSSREEDDDPSDDDNDDDDDDDLSRHGRIKPRLGIYRKRTVTRSKLGDGDTRFRATKSESGHASISHVQAWRSHSFVPSPAITPSSSSHDEKTQIQNPTRELPEPQQRSQSSLGFTTRQRASISVSAVLPSAAAKRASAVVTKGESKKEGDDPGKPNFGGPSTIPNPSHPSIPIPTHKHAPSTSISTITADSDSDNAPLALLMQPRRPGSALSHISNARSTSSNKPKPLIDISELTGNTMRKGKGKAKENDLAFTGGATLISAGPSSILGEAVGGRVLSSSPTQMSPPLAFSVSPPTKFVSPPASPVREARELPPGEYSVKSQEQHVGKREAPISERLSRIVQSSVGGGSGSDPNANANANTHTKPLLLPRLHLDRGPPTSEPTTPPRLSPPDQGLADILGGSVRLISREGESESEGEGEGEGGVGRGRVLEMGIGSGSSKGKEKEKEKEATTKRSPTKLRKKSPPMGKGGSSRSKSLPLSLAQVSDVNVGSERERERENERENERGREREDRIAPPIPIKQRAPTPSFSVTSRPVRSNLSSPTTPTTPGSLSFSGGGDVDQGQGQRQSITTMVSNSSSPVAAPSRPGSGPGASVNMNMNVNRGERQRSSTLLNGPVVLGSVSSTTSSATATAATATTTTALKGVSSASPATGKPAMSKSSAASPMAKSPTSTSTPTPTPPAPAPTQAPAPAPPPAPPPLTAPTPRSSSSSSSSLKTGPPPKPFAAGTALKRESPASSTGDSSSGRVPFTPRDGSEVESASVSASEGPRRVGVGVLRHGKRWSVSFEDELGVGGGVGGKGREREVDVGSDVEERRRERRRGEARAAIELGNVINGRGPIIDEDDDEDDLPINQTMSGARMSAVNPMMGMGGAQMPFGGTSPSWNPNSNLNMNPNMTPWQMQMQMQMNPQIPIPMPFMNMNMPMNPNPNPNPNPNLNPSPNTPGVDPSFILAHQQAMMYAKQAYQMAVAQQAMAAAGDEWERGSSIGGFGGGGSVYGGGAPGFGMSVGMGGGMGMGGGTGMGMGGGMGNGWSTSSVIFPPSSRSMYAGGFSGARSEYGGGVGGGGGGGGGGVGGGGGAWSSSRSSYGEFGGGKGGAAKSGMVGTGGQRNSGLYPPIPQGNAGGGGPNVGRATPRSRTASQPANVGRGVRRTPPPSSWKAGV